MSKKIITSYKSIKNTAQSQELIINKSRFIGYASHCLTKDDALRFIDDITDKHPEASCLCHAYICGMNKEIQKFNNGHEPVGGMPILNVLKQKDLTAVCCVVVRYFGGIKLGKGNLARAFSNSANDVISKAVPCTYDMSLRINLEIDYSFKGRMDYMLINSTFIKENTEFTSKVSMDILCTKSMKDELISKINQITNGNHKTYKKDIFYKCW